MMAAVHCRGLAFGAHNRTGAGDDKIRLDRSGACLAGKRCRWRGSGRKRLAVGRFVIQQRVGRELVVKQKFVIKKEHVLKTELVIRQELVIEREFIVKRQLIIRRGLIVG